MGEMEYRLEYEIEGRRFYTLPRFATLEEAVKRAKAKRAINGLTYYVVPWFRGQEQEVGDEGGTP